MNNFNFWIDSSFSQGAETGRMYGITSDCSNGTQVQVFPGADVPTQSWRGVNGFRGMTIQYGTYINNLGDLGGSGPQSTSYYCADGEKLTGYSVAVRPDAVNGTDYATGIRFYCGDAAAAVC